MTDEKRLNNPLSCPICGCREVGLYEKRIPEDPEGGVVGLEYSIRCPECRVEISAGTACEVVERWGRYAKGKSEMGPAKRLNDLRRCPFCDSDEVYIMETRHKQYGLGEQTMYTIRCENCFGQIKRADPRCAVEAWNMRGGISDFELTELERDEAENRMIFGEDGE